MNLDLVNNLINHVKNNVFDQDFINELKNYLKNSYINREKEDISLLNTTHDGNKIISKYRDKMLIERSNILIDYAKQTLNKGQMYYIYSMNSKTEDCYNLYICEEGKNHNIIEESKSALPIGSKIGSVLRKSGDRFILDEEATKEIEEKIYNMKNLLLEEQKEFLESRRIEGHIYEMAENEGDRALLFDITNNSNEGIEEIDFPEELLKESKEGDLFIYKNGKYQKQQN